MILLAQAARDYGISPEISGQAIKQLTEAGLLEKGRSLSAYVRSALDYVRRIVRAPRSVETEIRLDPVSGAPTAVVPKITFREPSVDERSAGLIAVDDLLGLLNEALNQSGYHIWLLLDRLDVA